MRTLRLRLALAFVFATLVWSLPAAALGVRPLVLDLHMRPGETETFDIFFSSSGFKETVNLTVYEARQTRDGTLQYMPANRNTFPPARWVTLEQERVVVGPDDAVRVPGRVHVPFDAAGSYVIIVMVEPEADEQPGVTVRVRYAMRLQIHVEQPGLRPAAEVTSFALVADDARAPRLEMRVRNTSRLLYDATGEVVIRDAARRLVERVPMHTELARRMEQGQTPLHPGAEVVFTAPVTEPLAAGDYELTLFLRYAGGRQLVRTHSVTVAGEQFADATGASVVVQPEKIDLQLRSGGIASVPLALRNRSGDMLHVGFRVRGDGASRTQFETFEIRARDADVHIDGRRTARTVFTVRVPRQAEAGTYSGVIDVYVSAGDEVVDDIAVPVRITVTGRRE